MVAREPGLSLDGHKELRKVEDGQGAAVCQAGVAQAGLCIEGRQGGPRPQGADFSVEQQSPTFVAPGWVLL